jgi:hypothetical protein
MNQNHERIIENCDKLNELWAPIKVEHNWQMFIPLPIASLFLTHTSHKIS